MKMRQRRRTMIAQMDRFIFLNDPWLLLAIGCDPSTRRVWDITMPRWKAGERRAFREAWPWQRKEQK